jgi:hypothetical protein
MLVLAVSFALPFIGYLIGAGLVLASKAWEGHDKAIALLIPPFVVLVGGSSFSWARQAPPKASHSTPPRSGRDSGADGERTLRAAQRRVPLTPAAKATDGLKPRRTAPRNASSSVAQMAGCRRPTERLKP